MASPTRSTPTAYDLALMFGDSAQVAAAVLDKIRSRPTHSWQPLELAEHTGVRLVDVMVILARLTIAGLIHHDGLGSGYCSKEGRQRRTA